MIEQRIQLGVAAYLDSTHARELDVARAAQTTIVQRFLACCFDDVAKEARLLDGDDLRGVLGHLLPRYFGVRDKLASDVEEVLNAFLRHLREAELVPHAYELGMALDSGIPEFLEAVRSGRAHADGIAVTRRIDTVQRGEKVGRNELCPCGSGKKFKKCCMKLGS